MVSGLMDDTPLGRVVGVRSETNQEIIKQYTPEQRAICNEWARFKMTQKPKASEEEMQKQFAELERAFAKMFG